MAFMLGLAANRGSSPAVEGGWWFKAAPEGVRDCDFAECTRGGCDAASAPFLCLDPKTAYMGCNAKDWGEYCSDSCTMVRTSATSVWSTNPGHNHDLSEAPKEP